MEARYFAETDEAKRVLQIHFDKDFPQRDKGIFHRDVVNETHPKIVQTLLSLEGITRIKISSYHILIEKALLCRVAWKRMFPTLIVAVKEVLQVERLYHRVYPQIRIPISHIQSHWNRQIALIGRLTYEGGDYEDKGHIERWWLNSPDDDSGRIEVEFADQRYNQSCSSVEKVENKLVVIKGIYNNTESQPKSLFRHAKIVGTGGFPLIA